MSLPAFDGSEYRRTVLTPLRSADPAGVDDAFWLGHVPRDLDDATAIAERLRETKAFLHKERSRPRQADVAAAVLGEWARVEGVLGDGAARRSLRTRLASDSGAARQDAAPTAAGRDRSTLDPAIRRRRQVRAALVELARLRADPDLAEDLFAFLGLPLTATKPMIGARMEQVADANRRRRADRERSLVDELLMHGRELLVDGDPAAYRAGLAADGEPDGQQAPAPPATSPGAPLAPILSPARVVSAAPVAPVAPPVDDLAVARDQATGAVVITWSWPEGMTEAFVAVGATAHPSDPGPGGRKFTNMKYALEEGARIAGAGAPAGTVVRVFSGRRDAAGVLTWNDQAHARETIVP